jgi:N-acetylneuraminic acid mutarotase
MVYVPGSGKIIYFGGTVPIDGATLGFLSDTWAYDPAANTWAELRPTGDLPSARAGHSMVYDPTSGKVLLFGGLGPNGVVNDTWAYDPVTNSWAELNPLGDVPSARYGQDMVYDPTSGRMLLFWGKHTEGDIFAGAEFIYGGEAALGLLVTDTWAYDPAANTWAQLLPAGDLPSARSGHAMVYDPGRGRVILFSGMLRSPKSFSFGDTWSYDPARNTWTELNPGVDSPIVRWGHEMVYVPGSGNIILFGGGPYFDDTWLLAP